MKWCLFAQPENVYCGAKVRLEAVLANEDVLLPGDYPVRLQVVGPDGVRILDKTVTLSIPKSAAGNEPAERPFALPVFAEDVAVTGPAGKYRLVADFVQGAAATCGRIEFYAAEAAEMPKVPAESSSGEMMPSLPAGSRATASRPGRSPQHRSPPGRSFSSATSRPRAACWPGAT